MRVCAAWACAAFDAGACRHRRFPVCYLERDGTWASSLVLDKTHLTIKSDRCGSFCAESHPAGAGRMNLIVDSVINSLVHDRPVIRARTNPAGCTQESTCRWAIIYVLFSLSKADALEMKSYRQVRVEYPLGKNRPPGAELYLPQVELLTHKFYI